nr:hypothetical protein HK105_006997 [Polyrhizophydium stewartii]
MVAPKRLDSTGAFRVHEAKMDGATFVLKEFLESIKGNEKSIEAEARKWFNANHPNLMQLTGVCLSSDKETGMGPFFAMPFVEYDLESFMNTYPDLDTRDRLKILVRIARGIKYLHNLAPGAPIVHGSLSFRHIRIEADFEKTGRKTEMKLRKVVIVPSVGVVSALNRNEADALLMSPESRLKSAVGFKDGQFVYDFNWDDPENATKLLPKPPRDIYSFGILAGALLSRMTVAEFCESEKTPPQDIDGDLWEVLLNAANTATEHRPEIDKILEHLNQACKTQHELSFLRGTATDIEIICTIFPVWAQDGNITFSSNDPKGDLVYVYDPQTQRSTQTWRLEWNSRHALTSLQCDISGEISDEIGNLTHLRELWLDSNQFEGEIPRSIGRIRGLQSLKLSRLNNNKLTGSVPVTLCQLTELRELDLSDNSITSLPSMISDLVNLRMLDLSDCLLTEIPEEVFMLENLEILSLAYHVITAIPPEIGQLRRLTSLNMERNEIKELPDEIGNLRLLTKLYLEKNQIKKLPEAIGNLESLEILDLDNNMIKKLPDEFCDLKRLKKIFLTSNQLEELPESFGNLAALKNLNLENNPLEELPDDFGNFPKMFLLMLSGNPIKSFPEGFSKLSDINLMYLNGNQLKELPQTLRKLKKLENIRVSSNCLSELPDEIGSLSSLKSLDLDHNQLESIPESIGELSELNGLYLSDNHLTYVHLQEHHLPKIVTMYDAENPYVQNRPADEQDGGGAENDAGAQEAEGGDAEPQEGQDSQPESSGQPAGEEGGEDETAEEHKDADADE